MGNLFCYFSYCHVTVLEVGGLGGQTPRGVRARGASSVSDSLSHECSSTRGARRSTSPRIALLAEDRSDGGSSTALRDA